LEGERRVVQVVSPKTVGKRGKQRTGGGAVLGLKKKLCHEGKDKERNCQV